MTPRAAQSARAWLDRLCALAPGRPLTVLNVCGGHERSLADAGLRAILPSWLAVVPGPGCPVCVCPEADIAAAMALAQRPGVTVATFGDMMRVPVARSVARSATGLNSDVRSLAAVKAAGGRVRAIASPLDARALAHTLARADPSAQVVLFAPGFETTMAPVAALLAQGVPANLSVLLAGRRTAPVVAHLLAGGGTAGFDGLIAPGHVATVMGATEWAVLAACHRLPTAVAGFSAEQLLAGLHAVAVQAARGRAGLANCYGEAVRPAGNPGARALLDRVFRVTPAAWRGIGTIPASGFALAPGFADLDARARFHLPAVDDADEDAHAATRLPAGCDCAAVVLGRRRPTDCRLYGRACTPRMPVGPCMVSDEGACRIWWAAGRRAEPHDARPPVPA
ncbi:hydrogenase formation protein HypD [Rhodothalassium salexigens]|uniref:hydrogenase formation protein HypD n=1 Tax=Rhodothalassium salexigens TaxID=1086 RepID=UPI001911E7BB|nr:hydrogenase formation protein HypD [Rhodothalassium salexigens]MBK5919470.1 hydrogenase formation protein HypD [Rhodothalassium salexigens]